MKLVSPWCPGQVFKKAIGESAYLTVPAREAGIFRLLQ
jgi:hypothetical protein